MQLKEFHRPPVFADDEATRIGAFLHVILLSSVLGSIIMSWIAFVSDWPITFLIMFTLNIAFIILLILNHLGYVKAASVASILFMLGGASYSAYIGEGIHDIGIAVIPLTLVLASLLLDKVLFTLFAFTEIVLLGIIEFLRYQKYGFEIYAEPPLHEFIFLSIILAVTAVSVRLLMDNLIRSLQNARHSELRYRNIYENLQEVYYEATADGEFIEISPAVESWFNKNREELIGSSFLKYFKNKEDHRKFVREVYSAGKLANYELTIRDDQNKTRHLLISASLIRSDNGQTDKIVGTIRDITENKLLEQQFLHMQKMDTIGKLAGGIAHDFNNLLNVISGSNELALLKLADNNTEIMSDLQAVNSACTKATNLTRQLLTISKKSKIEPESLHLNQILRDLEDMVQRILGPDIELRTGYTEKLPKIKADPGQIEQVMINLVLNARDAILSRNSPVIQQYIRIETRLKKINRKYTAAHPAAKSGSFIEIEVSDSGAGIPEEIKNEIFDPFFTTKEEGTGLGLSTVYGIIDQNKGFIEVESRLEKGTTFRIYLPVENQQVQAS